MKKILIILFVSSLLLIAACGQSNETNNNVNQAAPLSDSDVDEMIVQDPASSSGEVKEFTMTAKQWEFSPETITVNQGDKVKLIITNLDVTHGFNLPEFNINKNLRPGEETVIEFTADKKGTFTFSCNVYCGEGHSHMEGTLIVN